ncbi:hypothetical protein [Bacteroides acidifaciens]|uniref:hypothetical protein n=1 Tax=Bacteroides acidifaciens TaxID=85831 RepID=UPI003F692B3B
MYEAFVARYQSSYFAFLARLACHTLPCIVISVSLIVRSYVMYLAWFLHQCTFHAAIVLSGGTGSDDAIVMTEEYLIRIEKRK